MDDMTVANSWQVTNDDDDEKYGLKFFQLQNRYPVSSLSLKGSKKIKEKGHITKEKLFSNGLTTIVNRNIVDTCKY